MNTRRNFDFLRNKIWSHKIPQPPKPKESWHNYAIFSKYFYFARCTKCKGLVKTQNNRCQLCIILVTGCQNLGRLNRKLSGKYIGFICIVFKPIFNVCFNSDLQRVRWRTKLTSITLMQSSCADCVRILFLMVGWLEYSDILLFVWHSIKLLY